MITMPLGVGTVGAQSGFIGQLRYMADQQGLSTSGGRHPDADLIPLINDSYRSLRDLVMSYGYTLFLVRGTTTALPTTAVETNERYAVITTSVTLNQIKAIHTRVSPDDWRELPEVPFLQLRDVARRRFRGVADAARRPLAWCWLSAGSVSGSTFTGGQIAIAPVPTSGDYSIWSMPEWTNITSSTDIFLFQNEDWRQWMLYDAMLKVVGVRDKNNAAKFDFIMSRLDPNVHGSPAYNIRAHAPTAAGPKTWTRSSNYNGVGYR